MSSPQAVAFFDFDGTLSRIRSGWQTVMADYMLEVLFGNAEAVAAQLALREHIADAIEGLSGRPTTAEEVNALFRAAAAGELAGILGFEARALVSADYARDTRSSIVDGPATLVTDGTLLKVYAWYDNEMGYACRMVDLACHLAARGL